MFRKILVAAIVSTSLAVFGQTASNSGGLNGQMASTVAFASPTPTAGISQAGLAGISDHAPIQQGVQSTLGPSPVVYTSGPQTVFYAGAPSASSPVNSEAGTAETNTNLGSSTYSYNVSASSTSGLNAPLSPSSSLSLGEVAVQNKARAHNARTYTNADLQQMLSRNGSGNVMVATNRAPSAVPVPAQNTQASAATAASPQSSSNTTASIPGQGDGRRANTGAATPSTPAASGSEQSSASPNASSNGAGQTSTAQNAENNTGGSAGTTPQTRQRQSSDAQAMNRLPATSTILPLLGLIGLASSGAGLWYRRNRKIKI